MNVQQIIIWGLPVAIAVFGAILGYMVVLQRSRYEYLERWLGRVSEDMSINMQEQRDVIKEGLQGINEMFEKTMQESKEQIEKNQNLFNEIQRSSIALKEEMQEKLSQEFKNFGEVMQNLKERLSQDSGILKEQIQENLKNGLKESGEILKNAVDENTKLFEKFIDYQKEFKGEIQKSMEENFDKLRQGVDSNLEKIGKKVDERLKEGFENVDKTFKDIIKGIATISEAQKKIEDLSSEVVDLQKILADKKTRGTFGEAQLETVLKAVFGESREFYEFQFSMDHPNEKTVIVDAVIKLPMEPRYIPVDSKFPLENFRRMIEEEDKGKKDVHTKAFKQNLKKHINDISSKYIIENLTQEYAVMYLPSEALYSEVQAYHQDIVLYARERKVMIAGPTTILAILSMVQSVAKNYKTQKYAKRIQEELAHLSENFRRYKERWEILAKDIKRVNKDVENITITTNKISLEFEKIKKVEWKDENETESQPSLPLTSAVKPS